MVREWPIIGGMSIFPYQCAFGVSVRWGSFRAVRLYFGPVKVWLSLDALTKDNNE